MVKIFVILDGIGDRACKVLDGLTPLEAAKTKNLDYFASKGNGGYVYAINEHIAPESDEAIMALLGYDPTKYYYGRGPLEAFGAGMEFKEGYLALRVNFATVEGKKIIDRRAGRTLTTKEAQELARTINEQVKIDYEFEFKATVGHRGVLVVKGEFSDNISNKKTKISSKIVNSFVKQSYEVLKDHEVNKKRHKNYLLKANVLLLRDAGIRLPELPKKTKWGAVVSMPLEIGITRLAGMNVLSFPYPETTTKGIIANLYKGLDETIKHSIKNIKEGKFSKYLIHFKEADVMGHDNNPLEKKKMIELIDKNFFGFLREIKELELVVTGDHASPCELRSHAADAVPLLHYSTKIEKKDSMQRFNESECQDGYYGQMYGKDVMDKVGF